MARQVTISLTDSEAERLDMLVVRMQNEDDFDGVVRGEPVSTRSLARQGLLAYISFHEQMLSGELDGDLAAELVIRRVQGMDYLAQKTGGDLEIPSR